MSSLTKPILTVRTHDRALVAEVLGHELNHETTQQLHTELDAALAAAPALGLVLDLTQVEFMPSMALAMLVNIHKGLTQRGRKCALVGIRPEVFQSMKITTLDKYFDVYPSVADGLQHV